MLSWFYASPFGKMLFAKKLRFLRQVMVFSNKDLDEQDVLRRHLACNLFMPWRTVALSRLNDTNLGKWVNFVNEDILLEHSKGEHGVVLANSHIGAGRVVALMLMRRGFKLTQLNPEAYLAKMGARGAEKIPVINMRSGDQFWLKELYKCKKVLDAGEILTMAADGYQGRGGIEHTFHDSARVFHVSFAQLALQSHSVVIPVFSNIDANGKITIEFQQPLDNGDENREMDDRIAHMLDQYVDRLEQKWRDNPGNILSKHLRMFLQTRQASQRTTETAPPRAA